MPTILCCLLVFVIWLRYEKQKNDKTVQKQTDEFWARERESNLTRRKDLSSLDYITIPFENLPFSENCDSEIMYTQEQLKKLEDQKIVNLSGLSNTDLKFTYGTANLNELSLYDQNYTLLIRNLNKWGQLLYSDGSHTDAKKVLEYAISIGSDISQTYLTLAAIYTDEQNLLALSDLISRAQAIQSPLKDSLLTKLTAIQNKQT